MNAEQGGKQNRASGARAILLRPRLFATIVATASASQLTKPGITKVIE
jgi:hypothetical protein